MIILQIFTGLLVLPLTILIFFLFNLYLINTIYYLLLSLVVLFYSLSCGLLFGNLNTAFWLFILLGIIYLIRMRYFAYNLHAKTQGKNYLLLKGKINSKKYKLRIIFYFPLGLLNVFKFFPSFINHEIAKQIKIKIEMPELIELVLNQSIGTQIKIVRDSAYLCFKIQ